MLHVEWLERQYPHIKWREPIQVSTPHGSGLGCRVCIGAFGIKATDARTALYPDQESFDAHFLGHLIGF